MGLLVVWSWVMSQVVTSVLVSPYCFTWVTALVAGRPVSSCALDLTPV